MYSCKTWKITLHSFHSFSSPFSKDTNNDKCCDDNGGQDPNSEDTGCNNNDGHISTCIIIKVME